MPRRKAKKIFEAMTLPNVYDPITKQPSIDWATEFGNANPLILELGCGTGQYTLTLAEQNPDKNVIGIDMKAARLWSGAKIALEKQLTNAAFLRLHIRDITTHIPPASVSEIWITFPDPFPRLRDAKHRLTSPLFIERYQQLLCHDGRIHLKTDDPALFAYTLDMIAETGGTILRLVEDVYRDAPNDLLLTTQTTFEKKHLVLGRTIRYVAWRPNSLTPRDEQTSIFNTTTPGTNNLER